MFFNLYREYYPSVIAPTSQIWSVVRPRVIIPNTDRKTVIGTLLLVGSRYQKVRTANDAISLV